MPTKHAILAELTANELRASIDFYELAVADRRVKPQLVDALARPVPKLGCAFYLFIRAHQT